MNASSRESAGVWSKRFHLAVRATFERVLRPFGLGSTQWYVLAQLAQHGPTAQGAFPGLLGVEKATLSKLVATLVRKGLVRQGPDPAHGRRRVLTLTPAGRRLWRRLPDPVAVVLAVAFDGVDADVLDTVAGVLRAATGRLNDYDTGRTEP